MNACEAEEFMPMEDVHALLLYLIQQVNRVSEETGIPYFAHAGTLIGVLRHQGFIPWDDDVDLLMERKYYQHFVDACKRMFPEQIAVRTREDDPTFCEEYIKICFRDEKRQYSELSVDIFIMDETDPARKRLRWLQNKIIKEMRPIKLYKVSRMADFMTPYMPHNVFKRTWLAVTSLLPLTVINGLQTWAMTADKHVTDYLVDWGSNSGYKRATRPKHLFEKAVKMPFENTYIYASSHAEELADFVFKKSNWRELPPPEKRKSHHVHPICNASLDMDMIRKMSH